MYVKYIDENNVEIAPNPIYGEDKVYANPTHETLVAHGYFPLIETPMPVKEGYYYTYHYELGEETVIRVWDEHEVPPEPEPEPEPVVEEETPAENVLDEPESRPENVQDSEVEPEPEETQEQENEPDLVEENEPEVEPETEEIENEFAE